MVKRVYDINRALLRSQESGGPSQEGRKKKKPRVVRRKFFGERHFSYQLSVISYQLLVISYQLSVISTDH
ncbi:MAG: hypothetical protein F6K17_32985 [Okeania sp. SIO3C4]|nr:hypothetical protein [Okeania sp. SIO3C4]